MNKYLLIVSCTLFAVVLHAQSFYDMNTIQKIEITFEQTNWDALMDAEKNGDENYIMAKCVSINGTVLDSVGVKYKGNSTYNANQTKNPFHIELDTYKDQDYQGYNDIKLSNVAKDPSFLREVLSYQVLRQYMDAPESNYANVYVNGDLIGLYSNSEAVSKKFVNKYFYSKKNTFVKCNPPAGAGPQSNDFPNLVYLGQDSAAYYDAYELKSDDGWDELIELANELSNNTENIEQILDVDRAIWMLAYDNVLVNLDSYIGRFAQNYYLYKDDNGRFVPVVWDLNESFGRFAATGSGNLNGTTAKQQLSHLLNENDNDFPLVSRLLSIPMYRRMYLAHFKTILLENFDDNSYFTTGQALQTLIDSDVQADNNKFFTYNNFLDNLEDDVTGGPGPGGGGTPGIANLMDARSDYLLSQSDFTKTEPTISDITLSNADPIIGDDMTITVDVGNAQRTYLGFRDDYKMPFTRVEMFDDGMHNDGNAGDGVYGIDLTVTNAYIQYYIYAENDDIGLFSPRRAEHEYHSFTAGSINTTVGDLVINEFMASNDAAISDQDGEYDDWIELFNNSDIEIDLSGYGLSDDASELLQWTFPDGTLIEANGYLAVWADKDDTQDGLHANFKLSAAADQIILSDPNEIILDEVSFLDQQADITYGRFPNGTGPFQIMNATFLAENMGISSTSDLDDPTGDMDLFPNPSDNVINIVRSGQLDAGEIVIYNVHGQVMGDWMLYQGMSIDISEWNTGLYFVKSKSGVVRFVKM